ncbi:hypothetical protein QJQ45_030140, partial [Haematococcus lacustris]
GLWVHGNLLSSVPDSLAGLTALRQLSLSGNRINTLPDQLFHCMTHLTEFVAAGNQLTKVPSSLGAATALVKLALNGNRLKGLTSLEGLGALKELWLQGNQLQRLPDLQGLQALTSLSVADNRLTQLPDSLTTLTSLTKLWLYGDSSSSGGCTGTTTATTTTTTTTRGFKTGTTSSSSSSSSSSSRSGGSSSSSGNSRGNCLTQLPPHLLSTLPALEACWLEGNPGLGQEAVRQLLQELPHPAGLRAVGLDTQQLLPLSGSQELRQAGPRLKARATPASLSATACFTALPAPAASAAAAAVPATPVGQAAPAASAAVGEVLPPLAGGSSVGYWKLVPSPNTLVLDSVTGRLLTDGQGRLQRQGVLVVALGSAPGTPNWGGLLGRVYKQGLTPAERAFDVLYLVDPSRSWYGAAREEQQGGAAGASQEGGEG